MLQSAHITRVLVAILGSLVVMHVMVAVAHLVLGWPLAALTALFDMDLEGNLPMLFNVLLLLAVAIGFYLVARSETVVRDRRSWFFMAIVFVFLTVDEGSQIHEKLMLSTLRLLNHGTVGGGEMGWLYYAWIVPYGVAVSALLLTLVPWLLRLPARLRWSLLFSGGVFLLGAVFMESWSGKLAESLEATARPSEELPWIPCTVYPTGSCFLYADARFVAMCTVEEILEMTGLILCLRALIEELNRRGLMISVRFGARSAQ